MNNSNPIFVSIELYGVSITTDFIPGECYDDTCERGWWIRNKANQLIKRRINENHPPDINDIVDALNESTRLSIFWVWNKRCKTKYSAEIMKEIIAT